MGQRLSKQYPGSLFANYFVGVRRENAEQFEAILRGERRRIVTNGELSLTGRATRSNFFDPTGVNSRLLRLPSEPPE